VGDLSEAREFALSLPGDRVRELLGEAWRRKAGKRLAAELDAAADPDGDR
jgi:hypothetical protein